MLTHERPARVPVRLVQASKRPIVATWLEDPFWYWTHFCQTTPSKGQVVPCVSRVRPCRPCEDAVRNTRGGRKLHGGAAALVQSCASSAMVVEKSERELIAQFRMLPGDVRKRYGYAGYDEGWVHPSELPAARKYAQETATLTRIEQPVIEALAMVAIVELLAPVADEVQVAIGTAMPWRGSKTLLVPSRGESGLVTNVQLLERDVELPTDFLGVVAFLDEHWRKFGIAAMDAR